MIFNPNQLGTSFGMKLW